MTLNMANVGSLSSSVREPSRSATTLNMDIPSLEYDDTSAYFERHDAVRKFISFCVEQQTFVLGRLKREMNKAMLAAGGRGGMRKPNGKKIREMFDPDICKSGSQPLPPGIHHLNIQAMDHFHIKSCEQCRPIGCLAMHCYYRAMRATLTHGWSPPVDRGNISEQYQIKGDNYQACSRYSRAVEKSLAKLIARGALREWSGSHSNGDVVVRNPMGAVLKASDRNRARVFTGVEILDQDSLETANKTLRRLSMSEVKIRPTVDCSQSGLNKAAYVPSYVSPSIGEALHLVKPGCWLAKGDVEAYFNNFPLAREAWLLFVISWMGKLFHYVCCCFGFAPCPYFCSMWSSEFQQWMNSEGIPCSHLMDDWMTSGDSKEEAEDNIDRIGSIFVKSGFGWPLDKRAVGQQLVFLGFLIDTERMSMSFDATQARALQVQLSESIQTLQEGNHVDTGDRRHIAGKLNWFSEHVQSGRLHTASWWAYSHHGARISPSIRRRLIEDTRWWIETIGAWAEGQLSGYEYPILSASEMMAKEDLIHIVQSDASGTDGFGYFYGTRKEKNPAYVSHKYSGAHSSHFIELLALLYFLLDVGYHRCIVLWISDSESAVWSVNKGNCKSEASRRCLSDILMICDIYKIQLAALWVPREENCLADYLSHLSHLLNRDSTEGRIGSLGQTEGGRGAGL